jgi:hypothetical protein
MQFKHILFPPSGFTEDEQKHTGVVLLGASAVLYFLFFLLIRFRGLLSWPVGLVLAVAVGVGVHRVLWKGTRASDDSTGLARAAASIGLAAVLIATFCAISSFVMGFTRIVSHDARSLRQAESVPAE